MYLEHAPEEIEIEEPDTFPEAIAAQERAIAERIGNTFSRLRRRWVLRRGWGWWDQTRDGVRIVQAAAARVARAVGRRERKIQIQRKETA